MNKHLIVQLLIQNIIFCSTFRSYHYFSSLGNSACNPEPLLLKNAKSLP